MAKVGLSVMLALLVVPFCSGQNIRTDSLLSITVSILGEFCVGLILGYLSLLFFSIGLMAGQIIDVELGLGIGSIFDPQMGMQSSISGMFLDLGLLLYFLISNGHHRLLRILAGSLRQVPPGTVRLTAQLALLVADSFCRFFALTVSLMLPFICSGLLTEVIMGILMRAMPQMNAYMVGIPFKVLTGLILLFLLQPLFAPFCNLVFDQLFDAATKALRLMGGTS